MTTLDADTLRNLRNLLAKATPREWRVGREVPRSTGVVGAVWFGNMDPDVPGPVGEAGHTDAALIVALVNAAPALLDAAEAVERVQALADHWENDGVRHVRGYVDQRLTDLRAALAPSPDDTFNPYTDHDDEEDER